MASSAARIAVGARMWIRARGIPLVEPDPVTWASGTRQAYSLARVPNPREASPQRRPRLPERTSRESTGRAALRLRKCPWKRRDPSRSSDSAGHDGGSVVRASRPVAFRRREGSVPPDRKAAGLRSVSVGGAFDCLGRAPVGFVGGDAASEESGRRWESWVGQERAQGDPDPLGWCIDRESDPRIVARRGLR
jgi:hypothetical protein